jgi:integrase
MAAIAKVVERQRLKGRRGPYWAKIAKGRYVGFRKMAAGSEGTWLARCYDDSTGKQAYRPLGAFSELPEGLRYDGAQKAALEWFAHLGRGGSSEAVTVRGACERYCSHLADTRGVRASKDVDARFKSYVFDHKIAGVELVKLTPAHVEHWRKALRDRPTRSGGNRGERRSDSSLNRDMTCLRAALNLAYRDGLITSDFAWRSKLLPLKGADKRRDVYLTPDQRRALIGQSQADLAAFLRGLALVPLRPGALASLAVRNYDRQFKTLSIGKDKAGKDRKIGLPAHTAQFFEEQAKGKLPGAPLVARSNGAAWNKDAWKGPVKDAAEAAGLPSDITAYAVRHSTITDLIHSGVDTLTVAQLSGTSVLMIERHYGHLTKEHAREALARLAL